MTPYKAAREAKYCEIYEREAANPDRPSCRIFNAGWDTCANWMMRELKSVEDAIYFYAHPEVYTERETLSGPLQPGVLTENGDKARRALAKLGAIKKDVYVTGSDDQGASAKKEIEG